MCTAGKSNVLINEKIKELQSKIRHSDEEKQKLLKLKAEFEERISDLDKDIFGGLNTDPYPVMETKAT